MAVPRFLPKHLGGEADRVDGGGVRLPMPGSPVAAARAAARDRPPCRHDSTRGDGTLNDCCLLCGADGYWHDGHRHDESHPGGKMLFRVTCPDDE